MLKDQYRTILGREFGVAYHLFVEIFENELVNITSYTRSQIIMMMLLLREGGMTGHQIKREMALFSDEVTLICWQLENHGLIQFDKDKTTYHTTEEGEKVLDEIWSAVEKTESVALANFNDDEKAKLIEFLSRIQDNCAKAHYED